MSSVALKVKYVVILKPSSLSRHHVGYYEGHVLVPLCSGCCSATQMIKKQKNLINNTVAPAASSLNAQIESWSENEAS